MNTDVKHAATIHSRLVDLLPHVQASRQVLHHKSITFARSPRMTEILSKFTLFDIMT